jgi:hypothetical protein
LGPFNNAYCEEIAYLFFFFFFATSQLDWPITQKQNETMEAPFYFEV